MRTFRKLILHADVSGSGGNCRVLDTTSVINVSSGTGKNQTVNQMDYSVARRNNVSQEEFLAEIDYDVIPDVVSITELARNVVTYIGGYMIKMLIKTVHCEECADLLLADATDTSNYRFIKRRNLGNLFSLTIMTLSFINFVLQVLTYIHRVAL